MFSPLIFPANCTTLKMTLGVLRLTLGPTALEGHGAVRVDSQESQVKDDQSAGAPLQRIQTERVRRVFHQLGEKDLGRPHYNLLIPKGNLQERWRGPLY